jgi:hypothetical protein
VAAFFLQQTPVEHPAEEEAQELEYLRAGEWPQAGQAPLRRPSAVEAEARRLELRAVEIQRPRSDEWPEQHQLPSRNTIAAEADKLAVSVALAFVSLLPYQNQCVPGTPLSDSLLISKEIL